MFLKKIRILCLKRKIKVLKLDLVSAERERLKYVPGIEPKDLTVWLETLNRELKGAEGSLSKIYEEYKEYWGARVKKLEIELSEVNGYLGTLFLSNKVALKLLNKKIPSIKKKIAKAKKMQNRYP